MPQAVFCLLTALQFHELITQLPRQIGVVMPQGSHPPRIDYPPAKMVQFMGDAYSAGIEEVERDGIRLRIYSVVAKTVANGILLAITDGCAKTTRAGLPAGRIDDRVE